MKLTLIEKMFIVALTGFLAAVLIGSYAHRKACERVGGVSVVMENTYGLGTRKCLDKTSIKAIDTD